MLTRQGNRSVARKAQKKIQRKTSYYANPTNFTGKVDHRTFSYFDAELFNTVSTTSTGPVTLLGQLMQNTTGILANSPHLWDTSTQANDRLYNASVHITGMDVLLVFTGAQATALIAADLFNAIRLIMYKTGQQYLDANTDILTNVYYWPNLANVVEVYLDKFICLPSNAFNAADYNSPAFKSIMCHIPLDVTLECYTQANDGTTGWDTRSGDLFYEVISDSAATPHPAYNLNVRLYYERARTK